MMATIVYVLCGLTALACAALLVRSYIRTKSQLLFWSAITFMALSVANILLVVDLVFAPGMDLSLYRSLCTLGGLAILLYALVWESQ